MIAKTLNHPIVDAKLVEELAIGRHPHVEGMLVQHAREGTLKGIVTKPPRYSATTIQNFNDCERKFYWQTLAGLDSPPSEAMKFGTKLHAHAENWLKKKIAPQGDAAAQLANLGLRLLPQPNTAGLTVERQFELKPEVTGLPVIITGTKDLTVRPHTPDGKPDYAARHFMLGDHKTMRSRRYFGEKTQTWLSLNIQANVYAYDEWTQLYAAGWQDLRVVDKRWFYYFREDKQAELLRQPDTLEHVQAQFESVIKPRVLRMAEMVSAAPRIGDVPANESACDSYGGCAHRARCFGMGGGSKVMGAQAARFSKSGLLKVMNNEPSHTAAVREHGSAVQEEKNMGVLAGKFGKGAIAAKAQEQPPPPKGAGTAINPPAPRPFVAKATPVAEPEETQEETQTEEAVEEQEEQPKPKATKKTTKPKGAVEKVAEVAAQTEKAFAPKTSRTTPGFNSEHDFWLFVGCSPSKGFSVEPVLIETIIGSAQAKAAQGTNNGHYREGYGLLEASFSQWLEENALCGAVIVDPGSIVARDVVSLLRAHANVVVERRA